jgi:hypothetical protein
VAIKGGQLYVGQTRLNPKILENPLMALRPVMPLRTIVDQILMDGGDKDNQSCKQIEIVMAALHPMEEEKDIVENPQKHSELEGLSASTMIGA